jgi:hypothetical protein
MGNDSMTGLYHHDLSLAVLRVLKLEEQTESIGLAPREIRRNLAQRVIKVYSTAM